MRKTAYVRKTVPTDIPIIAAAMRAEDKAEVQAAEGDTPEAALLKCLLIGKPCVTICSPEGTPLALYGVTPQGDRVGIVWLLGAEELVERPAVRLRFLREARDHLLRFFEHYDLLWNCVDARNRVHVKWIQWMGFTFIADHPNYGAEGRRFLEFCKVKPCAPHSL